LALLADCSSSEENLTSETSIMKLPKIIGSKSEVTKPLTKKKFTFFDSKILSISDRSTDSITIPLEPNSYYSEGIKKQMPLDRQLVELIIDTSQILSFQIKTLPPPPELDSKQVTKEPEYFDHYPIYLFYNSSDSLSPLLIDGCLFMVQEAKDSTGLWRPLTYIESAFCGNSIWTGPSLNQDNFLLSKATVYDGETPTKFRMRLKLDSTIIYSNEYDGRINQSQFFRPCQMIYSNEEIKALGY
tara:strand:- start:2802 stop:3530 length:729 start_codon:yes stop_codon:yes gene_type:complete